MWAYYICFFLGGALIGFISGVRLGQNSVIKKFTQMDEGQETPKN